MGNLNSDNSIETKLEHLNSAIKQFIESKTQQKMENLNEKYKLFKEYVIKTKYKFSNEEFKKIEKMIKKYKLEYSDYKFLDDYLNFIKQNIQKNGIKNTSNQNQNVTTPLRQNYNNQFYHQSYQIKSQNEQGKQFSSKPYNILNNKKTNNAYEDMEHNNYTLYSQDYGMNKSQSYHEQLMMNINKQQIMQIQDQNHSYNIMGRILSYAENYANLNQPDKNFKRKYKYYDSFNASEKMLLNNYRNTFILQIIIFNSSYNNIVKNYEFYDYSKNLPKNCIINEIQQMKKKLINHQEDDKLYDSIINIINNKPININIFENEINKMKNDEYKGKCNPHILMSNIPPIKNNIEDLDDEIEKEYLNNDNYKPEMKLYEESPDMEYIDEKNNNNIQFRNINEEKDKKEEIEIEDLT